MCLPCSVCDVHFAGPPTACQIVLYPPQCPLHTHPSPVLQYAPVWLALRCLYGFPLQIVASSYPFADYSEESDAEEGGDDVSAPKHKPVLTATEMAKSITASGLGSLNRTRGLGTHRMTRGANRRCAQRSIGPFP